MHTKLCHWQQLDSCGFFLILSLLPRQTTVGNRCFTKRLDFSQVHQLKADAGARLLKDKLVCLAREALGFVHRRPSTVSALSSLVKLPLFLVFLTQLAPNPGRPVFFLILPLPPSASSTDCQAQALDELVTEDKKS